MGRIAKARAIFYDSTISTRRRRKSMNLEQDDEVEEDFQCCKGISILPDKKCMLYFLYMNSTQYTISEPRRNNNNSNSKGKSLFYGLHVPFSHSLFLSHLKHITHEPELIYCILLFFFFISNKTKNKKK